MQWADALNNPARLVCGIFFLFLTVGLLGCGFRGFSTKDLAGHLSVVRLESADPYDEMSAELARRLKSQGIKVLIGGESPAIQAAKLSLKTVFTYHTSSSMYSTSARIYTMRYVVDFALVDKNKTIAGQSGITVERDVLLQPNEMFETTSQVGAIKREMRDQMVRKMIEIMILKYENQTDAVVKAAAH